MKPKMFGGFFPAAAFRSLGVHRIITSRNMKFHRVFLISLIFTSAACFGADTKASSPEEFIRSLYRFHQPGKETPDWFGDKQTLSKYFNQELTALFIKDDECA